MSTKNAGCIAVFGGVEYVYEEVQYYVTMRKLKFKSLKKKIAGGDGVDIEGFYKLNYKCQGKNSLEVLNSIIPKIDLHIMETLDMIDALNIYYAGINDDKCSIACNMQIIELDNVEPDLDGIQELVHKIVNYCNSTDISGVKANIEEPKLLPYEIRDFTFPESVSTIDELETVYNSDLEIAKAAEVIERYYSEVITVMNEVVLHCKKILV